MFTMSDGNVRLEDRLNQVIIKLLKEVQKKWWWAERRKIREAERAEAERERKQAEAAAKAEKLRDEQFHQAAETWAESIQLRVYIEAVRAEVIRREVGCELTQDVHDWLEWAEDYVRQASPLGPGKPLPSLLLMNTDNV